MYLASPPLVRIIRHGNLLKVELIFLLSASSLFLTHNLCCGKLFEVIKNLKG